MVYGNNKLGKYRALLKRRELAVHLPPTKRAEKANVRSMLAAYGEVYLKPNLGTGGFGIYKLSRAARGYRLQGGTESRTFKSFDGAYAHFARVARKKTYLVQKGIPLLRYQDRPFDLRIMVQRSPSRKWEVTGMMGRLARPHKVVTNYHNGGRPMPVNDLVAPYIPRAKQGPYMGRLKALALRTSGHLSGIFPRFRAYGLDIGMDKGMKPWIIEVNTKPDKYIFKALADKRMFRKIMRYAR
ncbi:YheC/YheD family protein [Paenibacillus puerhi]|uniref:YheC/YheD family protein n=1 Tax=Paenibacillus puerhi TaxID=2692622 RepID=UPI00135A73A0|nr:YheC/YheD family protein [Paenibacillus puerhi]